MIDKSKELTGSVRLINNKLKFSGIADRNEPISIDYTPPLGDNEDALWGMFVRFGELNCNQLSLNCVL